METIKSFLRVPATQSQLVKHLVSRGAVAHRRAVSVLKSVDRVHFVPQPLQKNKQKVYEVGNEGRSPTVSRVSAEVQYPTRWELAGRNRVLASVHVQDNPLGIGAGQTISAPHMVSAQMSQELHTWVSRPSVQCRTFAATSQTRLSS